MARSSPYSNANSKRPENVCSVASFFFHKVGAQLAAIGMLCSIANAQTESSNPSVFCNKADFYTGLLGSIDIKLGDTISSSAESYKLLSSAPREIDSVIVNEYIVLDSNRNSTSVLIETVKCSSDSEVIVGITASAPQNLSSMLFSKFEQLPLAVDWIDAAGSVLQDVAPSKTIKQSSTSQTIELRILKAELSVNCPNCMYLRQYVISQCFLSTKANDRCGLLLDAAYSVVSAQ